MTNKVTYKQGRMGSCGQSLWRDQPQHAARASFCMFVLHPSRHCSWSWSCPDTRQTVGCMTMMIAAIHLRAGQHCVAAFALEFVGIKVTVVWWVFAVCAPSAVWCMCCLDACYWVGCACAIAHPKDIKYCMCNLRQCGLCAVVSVLLMVH